jgi:rRNA-processing protein EBP2
VVFQVKKELMSQAAKIEAAEIRRRQREAKKFGKAMQTERNLEKAKNKREDLNQIEKWRKGKDGKANPEKEEALLEASLSKNSTGPKKRLNDFIEEKTGRRPDEDDRGPRKSHKRLDSAPAPQIRSSSHEETFEG